MLKASKDIDVLVVVDALGALASGNLGDNIYLVDTNKHIGSYQEGTSELYTKCIDGQNIRWRVEAIDAGSDVSITGFGGSMITGQVCQPLQVGTKQEPVWIGMVQARNQHYDNLWYTMTLDICGKAMSFDPFLVVN